MSDWIDKEVNRLQKAAKKQAEKLPRNKMYKAVENMVDVLREQGHTDREIYCFLLGEYGQTGGNWYIMSQWLINDFLNLEG